MEIISQDKQVNIEINTLIDENVTKNEKKNIFLNKFLKKNKNSIELINKKEEVVVVEEGEIEEERVRWDSFTEYFLSIIGFVIDLGNVWRFPTVSFFFLNFSL